jgi:hypothetical protein
MPHSLCHPHCQERISQADRPAFAIFLSRTGFNHSLSQHPHSGRGLSGAYKNDQDKQRYLDL